MTNTIENKDQFDLGSFQKQVLYYVDLLQHPLPKITRSSEITEQEQETFVKLLKDYIGVEQAKHEVEKLVKSGTASPTTIVLIQNQIDILKQADKQAKTLLQNNSIRKIICAGLTRTSNDAFEIAKAITPLLATAILTDKLPIPLDYAVFASIAIWVLRFGVATLCADQDKEKSKSN